jgi:molecular chaperone GrpE (heat shock protein)
VLDAFDLVLKHFENASQLPDNPNAPALKRILSNYRAVQRKLARILSNQNISKIELPENQAVPGLCKVIRTEPHDELEPGTILEILKPGYQDPTQILRPVEVVTVAKTSSNQATSH